jgi:hypothetical protein
MWYREDFLRDAWGTGLRIPRWDRGPMLSSWAPLDSRGVAADEPNPAPRWTPVLVVWAQPRIYLTSWRPSLALRINERKFSNLTGTPYECAEGRGVVNGTDSIGSRSHLGTPRSVPVAIITWSTLIGTCNINLYGCSYSYVQPKCQPKCLWL